MFSWNLPWSHTVQDLDYNKSKYDNTHWLFLISWSMIVIFGLTVTIKNKSKRYIAIYCKTNSWIVITTCNINKTLYALRIKLKTFSNSYSKFPSTSHSDIIFFILFVVMKLLRLLDVHPLSLTKCKNAFNLKNLALPN